MSRDPGSLGLSPRFLWACRRLRLRPTRHVLEVCVQAQTMHWHQRGKDGAYRLRRRFRVSTSKYGVGQLQDSNRTPLGLHRVAQKIGGGSPIGTVFKSRQRVGLTWEGQPRASIVHRILWLEGLEPGMNRGGKVDSFRRYIYIHGFGDETTLGRPQSHGCIHLGARELIPLYDAVPAGTMVWIRER